MEAREVLEQVRNGSLSVEEAELFFRREPFEELGYAKLDTHRRLRSGFPEVVFCAGKSPEHLKQIYLRLYEAEGEVFGTRASAEQYELVRQVIPEIVYDPVSRILKAERPGKEHKGCIAVCTAGTADVPVAEEAAQTAEYFGSRVERIYDVGVAGIHRLLARLPQIQSANCIIAAAGMEGEWKVRDCWRQKDEGTAKGVYKTRVYGHATHLVRFIPGNDAKLRVADIREGR